MPFDIPVTAEGLMDREIDDHKRQRNLDTIPLRTRALQAIYRTGVLSLPVDEQLPRDPSSVPTGVIRA